MKRLIVVGVVLWVISVISGGEAVKAQSCGCFPENSTDNRTDCENDNKASCYCGLGSSDCAGLNCAYGEASCGGNPTKNCDGHYDDKFGSKDEQNPGGCNDEDRVWDCSSNHDETCLTPDPMNPGGCLAWNDDATCHCKHWGWEKCCIIPGESWGPLRSSDTLSCGCVNQAGHWFEDGSLYDNCWAPVNTCWVPDNAHAWICGETTCTAWSTCYATGSTPPCAQDCTSNSDSGFRWKACAPCPGGASPTPVPIPTVNVAQPPGPGGCTCQDNPPYCIAGAVCVGQTCQGRCGNNPCTRNGILNCVSKSYFKVAGGDVIAIGGIQSDLPSTKYLMDVDLISGLPGMAIGSSGGWLGVTSANVSSKGWLVGIDITKWADVFAKPENTFTGLRERVLGRLPVGVTPLLIARTSYNQAELDSDIATAIAQNRKVTVNVGGTNYDIAVIEKVSGDLTLANSPAFNLLFRKVIILLDNGNLYINSGLIEDSLSYGMLAAFVNGSITIANNVGSMCCTFHNDDPGLPADVMGVFFAQTNFNTGTGAGGWFYRRLRIEGTVIARGGVNLQRDYSGPDPAEYFVFNQKMNSMLRWVGTRNGVDQELVLP